MDADIPECFFLEDPGISCDTFLKTSGGGSCTEVIETCGAPGRPLSCVLDSGLLQMCRISCVSFRPGYGGSGRARTPRWPRAVLGAVQRCCGASEQQQAGEIGSCSGSWRAAVQVVAVV